MILGVGIDIVHNNRIRKSIEQHGDRFLDKIFTQTERAYCDARPESVPHYAARFAAKEAFIKACGPRLAPPAQVMTNIEVVSDDRGCPSFQTLGATARAMQPGWTVHLSLTHDKMVSAAVAVLEQI